MPHGIEITETEQELLEDLWQYQVEGRPRGGGPPGGPGRARLRGEGLGPRRADEADRGGAGPGAARDPPPPARGAAPRRTSWGPPGSAPRRTPASSSTPSSKGLDDKVCTFLGHPTVCPHGHPIPEGDVLQKASRTVDPVVVIPDAAQARRGGDHRLPRAHESGDLQKFLAMGVHPGDTSPWSGRRRPSSSGAATASSPSTGTWPSRSTSGETPELRYQSLDATKRRAGFARRSFCGVLRSAAAGGGGRDGEGVGVWRRLCTVMGEPLQEGRPQQRVGGVH